MSFQQELLSLVLASKNQLLEQMQEKEPFLSRGKPKSLPAKPLQKKAPERTPPPLQKAQKKPVEKKSIEKKALASFQKSSAKPSEEDSFDKFHKLLHKHSPASRRLFLPQSVLFVYDDVLSQDFANKLTAAIDRYLMPCSCQASKEQVPEKIPPFMIYAGTPETLPLPLRDQKEHIQGQKILYLPEVNEIAKYPNERKKRELWNKIRDFFSLS